MSEVTASIDLSLDQQIEQLVPSRYRGEKKVSMRTDFALREFLRTRAADGGSVGADNANESNQSANRVQP